MKKEYEHVIRPDEADAIVKRTVANGYNFRQLSPTTVAKYARLMAGGFWRWEQAAPVRLSPGRQYVSDGMHRLAACVQSGVALHAMIWEGDEWRAGINTDALRVRTPAQFLAALGVKAAGNKFAVMNLHTARVIAYTKGIATETARQGWTVAEDVAEHVMKYDEYLAWIVGRFGTAATHGLQSTAYGVFLFEIGEDDAHEWHMDMTSRLDEGDPLLACLNASRKYKRETNLVRPKEPTLNHLIHAWNLRRAGTSVRIWRPPPVTGVRFPVGREPEVSDDDC